MERARSRRPDRRRCLPQLSRHSRLPQEGAPPHSTARPDDPKPDSAAAAADVEPEPHNPYIAPEMAKWTRIYRNGHELIMPTWIVQTKREKDDSAWKGKLFLLDTGSFTNLISPEAAREVTKVSRDSSMGVRGLQGDVDKVFEAGNLTLQFASLKMAAPYMTAIDLTRLNVLAVVLTVQEAVKRFGTGGGSVINLSSVVGSHPVPGTLLYATTKGAIETLTRGLALELAPRKIRVNAIAPGHTETEGNVAAGTFEGAAGAELAAKTPLGRLGRVTDIAPLAVFLASDDSAWITGEVIRAAGGLVFAR